MKQKKKSYEALKFRAQPALYTQKNLGIKAVECTPTPSAAQKAVSNYLHPTTIKAIWALAKIKKEYPEQYKKIPEIIKFRNTKNTESASSTVAPQEEKKI